MPETHRNYFNRLAPEWDKKMPAQPEFREYLKEFGVAEGDRILDIGAGTGRMTRLLLEFVGTDGLVVAQDIAERMLALSRKNVRNNHALFCCEDVLNLAYRNETFDKILCFSAFPHFGDKPRALSEMHRALKPGGRLLILHTRNSAEMNEFHAALPQPVNRDRLPDILNLRELFEQSGLIPVRMEESENLYWAEAQKL